MPGLVSSQSCGETTPGLWCGEKCVSPQPCPAGLLCHGPGWVTVCSRKFCAGRFGATKKLSTDRCSGPCEQGWYCPPASTTNRTKECIGARQICPAGATSRSVVCSHRGAHCLWAACAYTGSAEPLQVPEGSYSLPETGNRRYGARTVDRLSGRSLTHCAPCCNAAMRTCPPGQVCLRGQRLNCSAGSFAAGTGNSACTVA